MKNHNEKGENHYLINEEYDKHKRRKNKFLNIGRNLEFSKSNSFKSETASININTTIAESEWERKKEMEKINIKHKNKSSIENKRFHFNKIKNEKYHKIGDYFKNETDDKLEKSSEELNSISGFYTRNLQSNLVINNDQIISIPEKKCRIIIMNSKDKSEYLNIFRNNIKKSFFKGINKKLKVQAKNSVKFKFQNLSPSHHLTDHLSLFKTREINGVFDKKKSEKFDKEANSDISFEEKYQSIINLKKNMLNRDIKNLQHDINYICPHNFQLISPTDFTQQFQNKSDTINVDDNYIFRRKKLNKLTSDKNSLRNELIKEIRTIEREKIEEHKKFLLQKWKKVIISAAIHFKKLNLTLHEFFSFNFSCIKPYENRGSFELFQAVKHGDLKSVTHLIEENKFLVYDYDYFNQTALHWAAKRNRFTIIPILTSSGANINAEDITGRTPLHITAAYNNLESLKILLYEMADPFRRDKDGKQPIDYTTDNKCKFYLSRARILHIIHTIGSVKKSHERIKFGFEFFFNHIEKGKFSSDSK